MQYQDHLSKFCVLQPLKSKRAEEVAAKLLAIFCIIGCPKILQSDNGNKFVNKVIDELVSLWADCWIVHGRPCHPQLLRLVERSNADVENMMRVYMTDSKTMNWSRCCGNVQWRKNNALNRTIKRSPFESVFGFRLTIERTGVNEDIRSEEDMDDPEVGKLFFNLCNHRWQWP